jgi:hypothetical protein
MNALALNKKEKKQLKNLTSKNFSNLSDDEKKEVLQLGVKDFSKRFGPIIQKLASE